MIASYPLLSRLYRIFNNFRLARDRHFDRRHGLDTCSWVTKPAFAGVDEDSRKDFGFYAPASFQLVRRLIGSAGINPRDFAFVDLGCGKGRALIAASKWPFKEVLGVEVDRSLYDIGQRNLQAWANFRKAPPPLRIIHADAASAALPDGNLLIFLYNPFGSRTMRTVAHRLAAIASEPHREVVILYANDMEAAEIEKTGHFERTRIRALRPWIESNNSVFRSKSP